jgi:hypothetical protein
MVCKAIALTLLLLITMTTTIKATSQTTRSTSQQDSNHASAIRENSPPAGTYWAKTYGGSSTDGAYSVQQTADGGYIVAGDTNSFGAGSSDAWVVKLGASGDIVWDGGSGVSTAIISLTPLDSSASVSTTSLTSADSAAAVQNTQVAARGSNARVTAQSGGGLAGQEIQLIMIGGLAAVAVVGLVLVALVVMERKKSPIGIRLEHSIEFS